MHCRIVDNKKTMCGVVVKFKQQCGQVCECQQHKIWDPRGIK